jgi:hypothetical protein
MNPFSYVIASTPIGSSGNVEAAAILAVLQLREEAYTSGFTRGPANSEWDYVIRDLRSKFGDSALVVHLSRMFAAHLGK